MQCDIIPKAYFWVKSNEGKYNVLSLFWFPPPKIVSKFSRVFQMKVGCAIPKNSIAAFARMVSSASNKIENY